MQLKLGYYPDIRNREILDSVNDGMEHQVMLTTNKLDPEFDKRDPRYISRLKEVKIIYKLADIPAGPAPIIITFFLSIVLLSNKYN